MQFTDLHNDILRYVSSNALDYREVYILSQVSGRLRQTLLNNDTVWWSIFRRFLSNSKRTLSLYQLEHGKEGPLFTPRALLERFYSIPTHKRVDFAYSAGYELYIAQDKMAWPNPDRIHSTLRNGHLDISILKSDGIINLLRYSPNYLYEALNSNNIELIQWILSIPSCNCVEYDPTQLLRYFFKWVPYGNLDVADLLLEKGARINEDSTMDLSSVRFMRCVIAHGASLSEGYLKYILRVDIQFEDLHEIVVFLTEEVGLKPPPLDQIAITNGYLIPYLLAHGSPIDGARCTFNFVSKENDFSTMQCLLDYGFLVTDDTFLNVLYFLPNEDTDQNRSLLRRKLNMLSKYATFQSAKTNSYRHKAKWIGEVLDEVFP